MSYGRSVSTCMLALVPHTHQSSRCLFALGRGYSVELLLGARNCSALGNARMWHPRRLRGTVGHMHSGHAYVTLEPPTNSPAAYSHSRHRNSSSALEIAVHPCKTPRLPNPHPCLLHT